MTTSLTKNIKIRDCSEYSPVILHVPHASTHIPVTHWPDFIISDDEITSELRAMTDHFTDDLVAGNLSVSMIASGLSRFVVDVERFPDEREEMLSVGMGAFYTHGSQRQEIRCVDASRMPELREYFDAYSQAFEDLVTKTLDKHGQAFILDIHSFPQKALPYEVHSEETRHEIIIGTTQGHTSPELLATIQGAFSEFDTGTDTTFKGAYVPLKYYEASDTRVQSSMLEIRRDLYMDEKTLEIKREGFNHVRDCISRITTTQLDACCRNPTNPNTH